MKSVIRSAKPYWIYLILTGKKKVEVGKNFPKSKDWNKVVEMYCSKDMRSFNRIPEKDREWMRKYLGKIACRFVCDRIDKIMPKLLDDANEIGGYIYYFTYLDNYLIDGKSVGEEVLNNMCLTGEELCDYGNGAPLYGWHISDLVIYDKPRELGEFRKQNPCYKSGSIETLGCWERGCPIQELGECDGQYSVVTRPPQSWCYVEEV